MMAPLPVPTSTPSPLPSLKIHPPQWPPPSTPGRTTASPARRPRPRSRRGRACGRRRWTIGSFPSTSRAPSRSPTSPSPGPPHLLSSSSSRSANRKTLSVIDLQAVLSLDESSVERLVASAADVGVFRIEGHGVPVEDLSAVVEAASGIFGLRDGELICGGGDGVPAELRWYRPARPEDEAALQSLLPDAYPDLRVMFEIISVKMEKIAETVISVISEQLNKLHIAEGRIRLEGSLICLRKYNFHQLHVQPQGREGNSLPNEHNRNEDYSSHALSLHVSLEDHEFCIRSQEHSASFPVPRGSIIVTLGKPLQDWCNGEFKCSTVEPVMEPSHGDSKPFFSMEFMCSSPTLYRSQEHLTKTITLIDQILIMLAAAFLYRCWAYVS